MVKLKRNIIPNISSENTRIFFYLVMIFLFNFSCSKEELKPVSDCGDNQFYYYLEEKKDISSELLNRYFLLGVNIEMEDEEIESLVKSYDAGMSVIKISKIDKGLYETIRQKQVLVLLDESYSCSGLEEIFIDFNKYPEVIYTTFTYESSTWICCEPDGTNYIFEIRSYGNDFLVNLKSLNDKNILEELARKTKTKIELQLPVPMETTFLLSVDKNSLGSALQMSNLFHESGKFDYTDPDNFYYDLGYGEVPIEY